MGHRQWTLSLPFLARFPVVKQLRLLKRLAVRLAKAVWRWQWFGSALQLTPHLHLLVAEAQWADKGEVVPVPPPSDEDAAWPEDDFEAMQQRAAQERLPLGDSPARTGRRRVAVEAGFSLHADTAVHANDRQGLERLARYGARGPVAECRLRRLDDGKYEYATKKGTTLTVTA